MASLRFDDVDYPDGTDSEPPADRRVRFADDRFLEFPQIRWSLSHLRELMPTVNVRRGGMAVSDLGSAMASREAEIDQLEFDRLDGGSCRWGHSLPDTYTDGILALHRGRIVYERYFGALRPQLPHACFSVTKSYAATIAAALLHEGVLDESRPVSYYVPELAASAYADATLREVLDMQVGVAHSELYSDPETQFWNYARAAGFCPRASDYRGAAGLHEYLIGLRKEGVHGAAFTYKSVNTEVLCWAMQRVTGAALPELLSQRLWSQLGCEEDAYISVDPLGVAMGGAGLAASLRDLVRFGELLRCEGARGDRQLIPAAVIADIRRAADRAKFAKAGYELLRGYSYRNMWWVTHNEHDAFEARGIHGQRLYIAPLAELVVARFASHPIARSAANDPITMPALTALGRLLGAR